MGLFDRFRKPRDTGQIPVDDGLAASVGDADVVSNEDFRMTVVDVFAFGKDDVVVVGQVHSGACRSGDKAVVMGAGGASVVGEATIGGVEAARKHVDTVRRGDAAGLLLQGLSRDLVHAGDTVVIRR